MTLLHTARSPTEVFSAKKLKTDNTKNLSKSVEIPKSIPKRDLKVVQRLESQALRGIHFVEQTLIKISESHESLEQNRRLLQYYFFEGLSVEEIAKLEANTTSKRQNELRIWRVIEGIKNEIRLKYISGEEMSPFELFSRYFDKE